MKWTNRIFMIGIMLVLFFSVTGSGVAVAYPAKESGYVLDKANLLTPDETKALNAQLGEYYKNSQNVIYIVTVEDLQGQSIANYARGLFTAWEIGKVAGTNPPLYRGVLIFVSMDQREIGLRVQVSDNFLPYIPVSASEEIGNSMAAKFENEQWKAGFDAGVLAVMSKLPRTPETKAAAAAAPQTVAKPAALAQQAVAQNKPAQQPARTTYVPPPSPKATSAPRATSAPKAVSNPFEKILFWLAVIVAFAILIVGIFVYRGWSFKQENAKLIEDYRTKTGQLAKLLSDAQAAFATLGKEFPAAATKDLGNSIAGINPAMFAQEFDVLDSDVKGADDEARRKKPKAINREVKEFGARLEAAVGACTAITAMLEQLKLAKAETESIRSSLPEKIQASRDLASNLDVQDSTKGKLTVAIGAFEEAQRAFAAKEAARIDWLAELKKFQQLRDAVLAALDQANKDVAFAAKARELGPKLKDKLPGLLQELDANSGDWSSYGKSKKELEEARRNYLLATQEAQRDQINWVLFYNLFTAAQNHHLQARNVYHEHEETVRLEKQENDEFYRSLSHGATIGVTNHFNLPTQVATVHFSTPSAAPSHGATVHFSTPSAAPSHGATVHFGHK